MKTPLSDRAQAMARVIQGSASRMGELIDNVMDFARGRLGGGLTLERTPAVPIEALLRQVVGELQTSAPASGDRRRHFGCHGRSIAIAAEWDNWHQTCWAMP